MIDIINVILIYFSNKYGCLSSNGFSISILKYKKKHI